MEPPPSRWRARLATLEAMALLLVARTLVRRLAFRRWRGTLGARTETRAARPEERGLRLEQNLAARRLARAVERAATRLPGNAKCLPQAMALQWMLRRRGLRGALHIGVTTASTRGTLDDLHAWVTRRGEVLIGDSAASHAEIYVAGGGFDIP